MGVCNSLKRIMTKEAYVSGLVGSHKQHKMGHENLSPYWPASLSHKSDACAINFLPSPVINRSHWLRSLQESGLGIAQYYITIRSAFYVAASENKW
jgi:hypothetical protein